MTRTEHLLCILMEECGEVAQRASKALRFGPEEIQPGQPLTNAERIMGEWFDLLAVKEMLTAENVLPKRPAIHAVAAKMVKVEKFLAYSEECGALDGISARDDEIERLNLRIEALEAGEAHDREPESDHEFMGRMLGGGS